MIRLERLRVAVAPGLPEGLALDRFGAGLNLVSGANASGKSTAARVARGLLWRDPEALSGVVAEARWRVEDEVLVARTAYGAIEWEGEPALPAAAIAPLHRLDLPALLEAGVADRELARRIAVELAGGYDLEAALAALRPPERRRGGLHRGLEDAQKSLARLEREVERLADREAELEGLRARLAAAEEAKALGELADATAELARAAAEARELEESLAALPPGLDHLPADAAERATERAGEVAKTRRELAATRRELEACRTRLAELRFPNAPPTAEETTAWQVRLEALEQAERERRRFSETLAAARGRLEAGPMALRPGPAVTPSSSDLADPLARLQPALDQRERSRAAVTALEQEVRLLEDEPEPDPSEVARLERGREALRAWLHGAPPPVDAVAAAVLGLGLATAAVGALVEPLVLAAGAGVSAGGFILVISGWLRARSLRVARRADEERAREAGVVPEGWEKAAVVTRLAEAERRLAELGELAARQGRARSARARLEAARENATRAEAAAESVAVALGLAADLPALSLLEQADRLRAERDAEREISESGEQLRRLDGEISAGLERLAAWFEGLGVAPPEDLPGGRAALNAVTARRQRLEAEEERVDRLRRELEAAEEELATREAAERRFWERIGLEPGDRAELKRRLASLPRYRKLDESLRGLAELRARLGERLDRERAAERLGLDPAEASPEAAIALSEGLRARAATRDQLADEIATIERDLEAAREGRSLEATRAAVAAACERLAEQRRNGVVLDLARAVLELAGERQRASHAPRVLRRAREWLGRFTADRWRLETEAGGRTLGALDTVADERRRLEELSDGTRIHLLLAARLAALEEAEAATGPLPLFLDEALATTDPARFRAVACALVEASRTGRQLVYLTADPNEAAWWRTIAAEQGVELCELELPGVRTERRTLTGVDLPSTAPPPGPGSDDATAYARALGAPPPDGLRPLAEWHVIDVLPDRLDTVRELVAARLDRVGPLAEALDRGAAPLTSLLAEVVRARAALVEAALEGWRIGRGRPVEWGVVEASGAISSRFADRVRELVVRYRRDPARFLEAVRGLKGFRSAKADTLEAALEAAGALDRRPALEREAVVAHALEAAGPSLAATGLDEPAAFVRGLLDRLDERAG